MFFDRRRHVQCLACGTVWGLGAEEPRTICPSCGGEGTRPVPFRFTLRGFVLLGTLALFACIVMAGVLARRAGNPSDSLRRPDAEAAPAEEPALSNPEPLSPVTRVGGIPCGICNGDGRIDTADRERTMPPFTSAPLGRCPACAGKGGLSR